MKRFYCKVCKKIKRVQKFPRVISTPKAETVTDRIGICNHHPSKSFHEAIERQMAGVK